MWQQKQRLGGYSHKQRNADDLHKVEEEKNKSSLAAPVDILILAL